MGKLQGWVEQGGALVVGGSVTIPPAVPPTKISQLLGPAVVSACDFPGADAGQRIAAAAAGLPTSGGTIDARCLTGGQVFSSDPFAGMNVRGPITVVMAAATFTSNVNLSVPVNVNLMMLQGAIISMNTGTTLTIHGGMVASSVTTHFLGTGSVVFASAFLAAVYPQWWGAGQGMGDTAAIQAAVNSLVTTGGVVYFPSGLYTITGTILVSSVQPIHLLGDMGGTIAVPSATKAALVLGATISGPMIRYTATDPANRGTTSGGGRIQGLVFVDLTNRGFSCTAVLDLHDCGVSLLTNCVFQWIKGSAILGENLVQSEISSNVIRYCGDTGLPAVNLPSTTFPFVAQSLRIAGNRIEVNYSAPYLQLGANAIDVSVMDNRFEADDTGTPASNQLFLTLSASAIRVIGNSFNRNTGQLVAIGGRNNVVQGNSFRGNAYPTTSMEVSGSNNVVSGNTFVSSRTGIEVLLSGLSNSFTGNTMFTSGSIKSIQVGNVIANNTLVQLTATSANLGVGEDFWIDASSAASYNAITGNLLDNNGGTITNVGAIRSAAAGSTLTGNVTRSFMGTGSGAIGVKLDANLQTFTGNQSDSPFSTTFTNSAIGDNVMSGVIGLQMPNNVAITGTNAASTAQIPIVSVSSGNTIQVDAQSHGTVFGGRVQEFEGTPVASASLVTLGQGNLFQITGATTINNIDQTGWQSGSMITLFIGSGTTLTLAHAQAGSGALYNRSGANLTVTGPVTVTYIQAGTFWVQVN